MAASDKVPLVRNKYGDLMDPIICASIAAGGLLVGALFAYLLSDRRMRAKLSEVETALAVTDQQHTDAAHLLKQEKALSDQLRAKLAATERQLVAHTTQLRATEQNLIAQRESLKEAEVKLRDAFANVSAEALSKNNEMFLQLAREKFASLSSEATGSLDQRKAQIEGLLKPMQEMLAQYQTRLGEIEKSRVESYGMLREQLGSLTEIQRTLNQQTSSLVSALRRPQTRGQWGEITLRRLVELAGMSNRCDFVEQETIDGEDQKYRPDMIVRLPAGREVIIDCKTALDAFLDAAATTDDDAQRACLIRHGQQVRNRARELGAKGYWQQLKKTPEFVVMFLPGEAFLYAAVEHDPGLIEDALRNGVIVATPTTLIALLKAIEFGWRQQEASDNAEEIRELGKAIYDRIVVFATHFQKVGASLESAVDAFNSSVTSLESRLMVAGRRLSELGAGSDKELFDLEPVDSRPRQFTPMAPPDSDAA
jgi:DNA recombination protein RmuC